MDSFATIAADGFTSSVNPVNASNGLAYAPGYEIASVLPNRPITQGNCASSPSRKNPSTVSPCDNFMVFDLLPPPEPSVAPSITCAQGNSSLESSSSEYG